MRKRKARLPWTPDPGLLGIVRVLLLLQAGFGLLSVFEVGFIGIFTGTLPLLAPTLALTFGTAVTILVLVAALEQRSNRARGFVIAGEIVVVLGALVDLALALLLTGEPLGLVPTLTRLVLPVGVIVLLDRMRARETSPAIAVGVGS